MVSPVLVSSLFYVKEIWLKDLHHSVDEAFSLLLWQMSFMVPFLVSSLLSDFAYKVPPHSTALLRSLQFWCIVHVGALLCSGGLFLPCFYMITLFYSCCCLPCLIDHYPPDLWVSRVEPRARLPVSYLGSLRFQCKVRWIRVPTL